VSVFVAWQFLTDIAQGTSPGSLIRNSFLTERIYEKKKGRSRIKIERKARGRRSYGENEAIQGWTL
jgi:hypothetical protein